MFWYILIELATCDAWYSNGFWGHGSSETSNHVDLRRAAEKCPRR